MLDWIDRPIRIAVLAVGLGLAMVGGAVPGATPAVASDAATAAREPLTVVTATGHQTFQVEVVDTNESRAEGLMFRASLPADQGMLFDFKSQQPVEFWMKNTYVALDMIFIRADGTIANIAANTVPLSEDHVPSVGRVRFVLEVVAGTAQRIGLKPGDRIIHRLVHANND